MLADTPFGVTTVPGVAAPRAVVIDTLGEETVIPELIDIEPTAVVALTPLTETITDPDTPCEAKAASAKLEAAKVIYSFQTVCVNLPSLSVASSSSYLLES